MAEHIINNTNIITLAVDTLRVLTVDRRSFMLKQSNPHYFNINCGEKS